MDWKANIQIKNESLIAPRISDLSSLGVIIMIIIITASPVPVLSSHTHNYEPLECAVDISKISFCYISLYWPKWAWEIERTRPSVSQHRVSDIDRFAREAHDLACPVSARLTPRSTSVTSAVETPTFAVIFVKFHCICNTLRSDYRSQCNLGDQLIIYYLCMLFKLFLMYFLLLVTSIDIVLSPVSHTFWYFRKCSGAPSFGEV